MATANNEARLLDMARQTTASQLEKICRKFRQVQSGGRRTVVDENLRYVSASGTESGMVRVTAFLFPEEAAVVMNAIQASARATRADQVETTTTAKTDSGRPEVSAGSSMDVVGPFSLADGLVSMSEVMLQDKKAARVSGMPVEVVLRVDAGRLADPGDEEVGVGEAMAAELDDGTGISAETSRRLSCDAGLVRVSVGDDGELLDVGRKTRTIPTPIRRALRLRDGGCRFPGCTNTRFVDGHHVQHWALGGQTRLSNLVELCRRHHRFVHEYGYAVAQEDGAFVFRNPKGWIVTFCPRRPRVPIRPASVLASQHEEAGLRIDENTAFPEWDGLPVNYSLVIDALLDPVPPSLQP